MQARTWVRAIKILLYLGHHLCRGDKLKNAVTKQTHIYCTNILPCPGGHPQVIPAQHLLAPAYPHLGCPATWHLQVQPTVMAVNSGVTYSQ